MTHSAVHASSSPRLPSAPHTEDLVALVRARLDAIENRALPEFREQCDCLTRIWYSDDADAIHIHVSDSSAVPCAPAGADRLASAVAAEAAMAREASALRDLLVAIEIYDAGGIATLAELDADGEGIKAVDRVCLVPRPIGILDPESAEGRAHASKLRVYLSSLRHELRGALRDGDRERLAILALEQRALRARLRRQMRQMRKRDTGTLQRSPRAGRMVRCRLSRSA